MNEHKAPGNEQATSPAVMPMKNNTMGTAASAPMKNNKPGTQPTAVSPAQTETPAGMKQTQAEMYQPGEQQSDFSMSAAQQPGYYPPATAPMGMYPSTTPAYPYPTAVSPSMYQPSAVQRSIFRPAATQGQGMVPQPVIPPRTSVMTSGLGVSGSVLTSTDFTQGYLQTQIGRYVKVEFIIGTNMLVDREGTLVKVGTDYIIIREAETDDYLLCDIYSIKFVRFYY